MGGDDRAGTERQGGCSLPVSRSFVVQFTGDTAPISEFFRGRVEHIESGRSRRFSSLQELVGFVADVLVASENGEQA